MTAISGFQKLPLEVIERIIQFIYWNETWGIENPELDSLMEYHQRDYDTFRKLCKLSSNIRIPRPLIPRALCRLARAGNSEKVMDLLALQEVNEIIVIDDKLMIAFLNGIWDDTLAESVLKIPWIMDKVQDLDSRLDLLHELRTTGSCCYKYLFPILDNGWADKTASYPDSADIIYWLSKHFPKYVNSNTDFAKLDNLPLGIEYADYWKTLQTKVLTGAGFGLVDWNFESVQYLLKHGISPGPIRLLISDLEFSTSRRVHFLLVTYLLEHSNLSPDYSELAIAIHEGNATKAQILLKTIETPSIHQNLLFACAVFQNQLKIAKLILEHPKFDKNLFERDNLFSVCVRRGSTEFIQLFEDYFCKSQLILSENIKRGVCTNMDSVIIRYIIQERFDDYFQVLSPYDHPKFGSSILITKNIIEIGQTVPEQHNALPLYLYNLLDENLSPYLPYSRLDCILQLADYDSVIRLKDYSKYWQGRINENFSFKKALSLLASALRFCQTEKQKTFLLMIKDKIESLRSKFATSDNESDD